MTSVPSAPETPAALPNEEGGEIVAKAGRYYRWTRYLVSVGLLIGVGCWFIRDGFFVWPREVERAEELRAQHRESEIKVKPHSEMDININRAIGLIAPPLGLALLVWWLYNSRGQYRLAGHTLYVPGHPPVPLDAIRQIDKTRWDRKGIAYIDYELPGAAPTDPPQTGRLKLDDFVYEQDKTDAILERIEKIILPPEEAAAAGEAGGAEEGAEAQGSEDPSIPSGGPGAA